jgi:hypothetical protein
MSPHVIAALSSAPHDLGKWLTKRRPIDFGLVAACLCRLS